MIWEVENEERERGGGAMVSGVGFFIVESIKYSNYALASPFCLFLYFSSFCALLQIFLLLLFTIYYYVFFLCFCF